MIEIKRTGVINKPIKYVWKVLFTNFTKVDSWVTGVYSSRVGTKKEGYDRVCSTFTGNLYETVLNKDEKNYTFEVEAKGLPFFVEKFTGGWVLEEVSENKTKASLKLTIITKGVIGMIMSVPLKYKLNQGLNDTLTDLSTYVESGMPSEAKLKEINEKN